MKELSDCRVLIVDDVKANVDILVEALSSEYKLSVALGGRQAIDAIHRNPPDLILLDIVMPDVDGYEICRRLRAEEAQRRASIIFGRWLTLVRGLVGSMKIGHEHVPFGPNEADVVRNQQVHAGELERLRSGSSW